jgi:nicotinate (nicotinamide) nucleotide adenylyltransferase
MFITIKFALTIKDLRMERRRFAVFGGSFNPPGIHHLHIGERLADLFDQVVVVPCGMRTDKMATNFVLPDLRGQMVALTFFNQASIIIDPIDLYNSDKFLKQFELDQHYKERFPEAEIWHVVGADLVKGGSLGESEIQRYWAHGEEVWQDLNFIVITRPGHPITQADLPPHHQLIEMEIDGSSTEIRQRILNGLPIDGLVAEGVEGLIRQERLYQKENIMEVARNRVYSGFCQVEMVDAGKGAREVVRTNDSVCILFYVRDRNKIMLVRQMREAAIRDDNPSGTLVELLAGRFDVNLGVKALAVKEAKEEAGASISEDDVMLLNNGCPMILSGGILTERSYLAYAVINSCQIEHEERIFGVQSENEAIQRVWLTPEEFREYICEDVRVFALREWFFNIAIRNEDGK